MDTYILRRLTGGISADWASDIQCWLEDYLEYVDWNFDEVKTYKYLEELKEQYSLCSYRKRAYQIRLFLEQQNVEWAAYIKPPPEPVKLPKRIAHDTIQEALAYFKSHPYEKQMKALILLGASSGMRPEEMYQLDQNDIDMNNCVVSIRHDPDNGYTVKTGKSRITFFSAEAQVALADYLTFFNNGCLLTNLFGKPHIERIFRTAPIRVKDLRKYFSQQWDRRGGPTSIKKILMGHSGDVDTFHYNGQSVEDLKLIYDQVMVKNIMILS